MVKKSLHNFTFGDRRYAYDTYVNTDTVDLALDLLKTGARARAKVE